jgi:hypothetical protein
VVLLGFAFIQAVNDDGSSRPRTIGLTHDCAEWCQNENVHLYPQILPKNAWVPLHRSGDGALYILSVHGQLVRNGRDEGGLPPPANRH